MKNEIINKLNSYGRWMSDPVGLNLKVVIDNFTKNFIQEKNFNNKYQDVLKLLYDMGIGNDSKKRKIFKTQYGYFLPALKNPNTLYDDEGNWLPINKLNTNYTALAHLVVDILEKEGKLDDFYKWMVNKSDDEIKKFLVSKRKYFQTKVNEHFKEIGDFEHLLEPIKKSSSKGDATEKMVTNILEKAGFKTLYSGGDGDLIDMVYGIDVIMERKGKTYLIQIKTNPRHIDLDNKYYSYITLFVNPTKTGIRILSRNGKEHFLDKEGKVLGG